MCGALLGFRGSLLAFIAYLDGASVSHLCKQNFFGFDVNSSRR